MRLLKYKDVEKLLSNLSFTCHIFNELCTMISKWLRLLRPKFETTQRNLFFKKSFLEGNLSQVSKMPNAARLQVHMHKLSSHLGSLGPGCVFYLKIGEKRHQLKLFPHSSYFQIFLLLKPVMEFSSCIALPMINLYVTAVETVGSLESKVNLPPDRVPLNTVWPLAWRNRMQEGFYKDLKIQEEIWHSVKTGITKELSRCWWIG